MKNYLKDAIPTLPCKNIKDTIEYYESKLGFEKSWSHEDLYGATFNGNVEIHLLKRDKEWTSSYIYLPASNVDELYEFLKENNVEVITPPVDRFYGLRECIIKDLNGHYLTFSHEIIGREPNVPKEN
ncbi:MAG: hypothetical protein JST55_04805 [Bacteroidetes bacterium]|nr:hypothetical protein [Bacteroidota bacterium]